MLENIFFIGKALLIAAGVASIAGWLSIYSPSNFVARCVRWMIIIVAHLNIGARDIEHRQFSMKEIFWIVWIFVFVIALAILLGNSM
jgi:hypothetical protein